MLISKEPTTSRAAPANAYHDITDPKCGVSDAAEPTPEPNEPRNYPKEQSEDLQPGVSNASPPTAIEPVYIVTKPWLD